MNGTRRLRRPRLEHLARQHTRALLTSDRLRHYIDAFSGTGLTSNPPIFNHAINIPHDCEAAST